MRLKDSSLSPRKERVDQVHEDTLETTGGPVIQLTFKVSGHLFYNPPSGSIVSYTYWYNIYIEPTHMLTANLQTYIAHLSLDDL